MLKTKPRFARQVEEKDAGDDEAMHFDDDYIRAPDMVCHRQQVRASVLIV